MGTTKVLCHHWCARPLAWLTPFPVVAPEVGLSGTLLTLDRIAGRRHRQRCAAWRDVLPRAMLAVALFCAGARLMAQP